MKKASISCQIGNKTLTFETGKMAQQASSSVLGRLGDTVVLVTVVEGGKTDLDYFPLSVDYIERLYAGGRIKGSRWVKREGRPSDNATLAGRLIDRSIRPLFPKAFKNQVQVIVTVLSVDGENEPDILALNCVSAALAISRIPWNGPIGATRMGYAKEQNGENAEYISNPTSDEIAHSELDIVVSQTKDKTVMIEAGASQVSEDILANSIIKAHSETQAVIKAIEDLINEIGEPKLSVPDENSLNTAKNFIEKSYMTEIANLIKTRVNKEGGGNETEDLINRIYDDMKLSDPTQSLDKKIISSALEYIMFKLIRSDVVNKQERADGRKLDEIRQIDVEVGVLPRTHGSALFQRGMTQALSIATLGSPRMEQLIESAEGEETKRYIHHYSGLPYSFGQAGRVGTPSRREIGHGALAERALKAVIPSQEDFPYTIMVVSEVLSQNGSSSMASTCGSTLALMDAGVPILKPVAGISIGMMSLDDKYELLTDIIGLEDFSGDMDFKVAGTDSGITAIQLDVKIPGLTDKQITEILERAKAARLLILDKMLSVISQPKKEVSRYAPKIVTFKIATEKIGELIGPGGKTIKNIIATTGAQVDVEDDGTVSISGIDDEQVEHALNMAQGLTRIVTPGEIFENSEVKRILPFGAFVEFLPGKEGMVHVSQMSTQFVKDPNDVVKIGDKVTVKVLEIDNQGRINLTMLLEGSKNTNNGDTNNTEKNFKPKQFENNEASNSNFTKSTHPLAQQFQREKRQNQKFQRKSY